MSIIVGIVGWRGMVGSVLMERMLAENDFKYFTPLFFSSSLHGQLTPPNLFSQKIYNSNDLSILKKCDVIMTTQGSSFTQQTLPKLRKNNWQGIWVDAASHLRTEKDSTLILDPVNDDKIKNALINKKNIFVGANCTVSLLLMAIGSLFKKNNIEWVSTMTYQAISGSGAKAMTELIEQMNYLTKDLNLSNGAIGALELEKITREKLFNHDFPKSNTTQPLAASLLPWIDCEVGESGQSKEEWKAMYEANKILGFNKNIPIDGTCVRVSSMRSHCQGLTIKLNKEIPLDEINSMIKEDHQWIKLVPNVKEDTLKYLTPANISGTLNIGVGRMRKMSLGPSFLNIFTVGDQLLWGAAEPLRRFLRNYLLK